jgi:hypothetical protein
MECFRKLAMVAVVAFVFGAAGGYLGGNFWGGEESAYPDIPPGAVTIDEQCWSFQKIFAANPMVLMQVLTNPNSWGRYLHPSGGYVEVALSNYDKWQKLAGCPPAAINNKSPRSCSTGDFP